MMIDLTPLSATAPLENSEVNGRHILKIISISVLLE